MSRRLLRIGVVGAVVTAVCCFTPVLVVLLSALGLSALTGYLDAVLLPALAIFLGLTGYALWKRNRTGQSSNRQSLARNADMSRPRPCRPMPASGSMTARGAGRC